MTSFEKLLINKGYKKYVLNCKTMKYEPTDKHITSTMVNLDHRYIHETDDVILKKIEQGKSVMDDGFTWDDRRNVICFGLNEKGKPPTLINPRPRIKIKKNIFIDGYKKTVTISEFHDDAMNYVLTVEKDELILKSLFDNSICFEYDLTNN